jgi:L-ascorbate metabolism protein UlaG (beta-lactamase superfamily)
MICIQRLNMDNSWFIHLGEARLVVDPWLTGKEVDFFPWFNTQWHRTKPVGFDQVPDFDFVLITQKYPDHLHRETLKRLNPKTIIVPKSVEQTCRQWFPGSEVISFNNGLTNICKSDVNLHCFSSGRKMDPVYNALVLENGQRSVFLASHGFHLKVSQKNKVRELPPFALLIAPFNRYKLPALLGGVVSPGLENVRELVEVTDPQKVIATHDEDKHAKGLISKLAKINRAPEEKALQDIDFLNGRYLHLDHYKPVRID